MTIKAIETKYKGYRFRSDALPTPPKRKIAKRANLAGKRFGRAVAEVCLGNALNGYKWWGLVCDCGVRFAARSRELARGHTRSCGCLQRDSARERGGMNRLPAGRASANELLASYKKSARDRGLAWQLDDQDFFNLVADACAYCGSEASSVRKPNAGVNGGFTYSGLDRLDSSKGYSKDNVVPCCWVCNRAKGALDVDGFLHWCKQLAAHSAPRSARFEHGETP